MKQIDLDDFEIEYLTIKLKPKKKTTPEKK